MTRKRFGIDIDGTVTCPTSLIPFINEDFSLNITLDDIRQYDLSKALNIPAPHFKEWFDEKEPIIYANSPIAEGAKDVLLEWKEQFQLFFISARKTHLLQITEEWFNKQDIAYDKIELVGSHDKIQAATEHNVDIFFEDKHDNAVAICEELSIPVVLFNTPYNQDPVPEGVVRVDNWIQAKQWVHDWVSRT
ncbi:nucleotidase [Bacillus thermotolerans]|uniref:nucleotidase n=1 Tax=Bacillus thermotolerans TaxID=1221996 RepID=UPI00057E69AA|nr:nucleotidase [Bacillus thermotolerans]KKB33240.1 HAD-superfamily hydrolase-like protein [Bacillus thermotolerans]